MDLAGSHVDFAPTFLELVGIGFHDGGHKYGLDGGDNLSTVSMFRSRGSDDLPSNLLYLPSSVKGFRPVKNM